MKLDVTSMVFNSKIEGRTATPGWGTSIGQNNTRECRIDDFKEGVTDIIIGMTYKSISDSDKHDNLDITRGSKNKELICCAVFTNIYINDIKINNSQYALCLFRERSESHNGRLIVSYSPNIIYKGVSNQQCIDKMQHAIGCSPLGCWFVYDISVKNQSDLYFKAVVISKDSPMVYPNSVTSQQRSQMLRDYIPKEENADMANNKLLQKIIYGTPGSGKSFKVKNDVLQGVDEGYIFRTTFHPDSDYASFVGCYKPRMSKMPSDTSKQLLETDELVQKLKEYLQGYGNTSEGETTTRYKNVTKACALFGFDYHDSLVDKDIKSIVSKAYDKEENSYDTTVRAGMECYEKGQVLDKDTGQIEYAFAPQAFTDAYVKAWQEPDKDVYLVIEEINRGNCAQIFGDLFQLLDRKNGVSEYPINADSDLRRYLEDVLGEENEGIAKGKLKLPANLNIIATMNTSDQSLFPMDSAFKRRWTWECVPIDYNHKESSKFRIKIGGHEYSWNEFLKEVNKRIFDTTDSEDKQMGNFFINADADERQFIDKVMFYLWNDICKEEYHTSKNFFRRKTDDSADGNCEFSFNSLFEPGNSTEYLMQFMEYLGVKPVAESVDSGQSVPSSPADNL